MYGEGCHESCSGCFEEVGWSTNCNMEETERNRAHPFEEVGYEVFKIEDF